MADFCRQCSLAIFGADMGDLKGLSVPEDTANERYVRVCCEGCGETLVDHRGVCVSLDCLFGHGRDT